MPENELNVGDIIESQCRKCNDITGHAIVSMVDGEVAKVECRACGSVHKHHPAKSGSQTKKAKTATQSKSAGTGRGQKKGKAAQEKEKIDNEWLRQMENRDKSQAVSYSMQGCYKEDELIDHPNFGIGIVQKEIMPNKIDVLFQEGLKRLRCDLVKEESTDQG